MTRSSQLAGTQTDARDTVFLGREGKQFELRDLDCRYSEQRTFADITAPGKVHTRTFY